MDLREVIRRRRSIRRYRDEPLDVKEIYRLLDEANLSPSAGNLQSRDFIIVDDEELKEKLAYAALNQSFVAEAPIVVVVCANLKRVAPYGRRGRELYCIQDSAAAIDHLLLLVEDRGLGACWVGAFDENMVSRVLGLPSYIRPVALIPIGYPDEKPDPTPRLPIENIVHYNGW